MPVKYLGSKKKLLPFILAEVERVAGGRSAVKVADLFSGTARVGAALRERGYVVHANDLSTFGYLNARCYIRGSVPEVAEVKLRLEEMSRLDPFEGYFTRTFCVESRFFSVENGRRVDACLRYLRERCPPSSLVTDILTLSLIEAADRVDSTTGVQMAYLKKYAPRAANPLELRVPPIPWEGPVGTVTGGDATEAVGKAEESDIYYLDPPYNQHSYFGNYHIWETVATGDEPAVYGVACKREDTKARKSDYNSKVKVQQALDNLLQTIPTGKHVILSYNNEGYIDPDTMLTLLRKYGNVEVRVMDYDRYVGAKIGIHSPSGEIVGTVKSTRNMEYLFTLKTTRTESYTP